MTQQIKHTRVIDGKTCVAGGSIIKDYLQNIYKMTGQEFYKWVLDRGVSFGRLNKLKEYENIIKSVRHSNKLKQCYYNSQMVTLNSLGDVDYYEGWYVTEHIPIPFEHGFNVYKGKVIDTTAYSKFGVEEYFGVKIPLEFIRKHMVKTGMAEQLLFYYYKKKVI